MINERFKLKVNPLLEFKDQMKFDNQKTPF